MKKTIFIQFAILLIGTLFAWVNFLLELISWLNQTACTFGCAGSKNPFLAPCFYGALFFTAALILSMVLVRSQKK